MLQQEILRIPEVAGWYAYYQGTAYHELWINSVTYTQRNAFTDQMITSGAMMNMVPTDHRSDLPLPAHWQIPGIRIY